MTPLLLLAALPCLYVPQGAPDPSTLRAAGIDRVCVPEDAASTWRAQEDVAVTTVTTSELDAREALPAPGLVPGAARASPTRAPWVTANGWRYLRHPAARFRYELPAGRAAALAAAEAFAHGGDVLLSIGPSDLQEVGAMMRFLAGLPPSDLPGVADLAVVDDGSAVVGEVLNLLTRRNLLYAVLPAPAAGYRLTVQLGAPEWPRSEAADPSAFALKVRRALTDAERSLRLYGSEVVIGRLCGDATRARLHLLNYGGREVTALRVRVRGLWPQARAHVGGRPESRLEEHSALDGATEFTLSAMGAYAAVDLGR